MQVALGKLKRARDTRCHEPIGYRLRTSLRVFGVALVSIPPLQPKAITQRWSQDRQLPTLQ
jgi:hypothetical protein